MKTNKILILFATAVFVFFTACNSNDEPTVTGIELNKPTLSLKVNETATLLAILTPSDAKETVTWSSSDQAIATVDNTGKVTGISAGTAKITATVNSLTSVCDVTIESDGSYNPETSLNGSNYYPIIMDGVSFAKIQDKVVADFRPDDETKFLYIWEETYSAGTSTGPNFYREVEGWVSLVVGSVGWSGAGFSISDLAALNSLAPVTNNPDGYYLHMGIKSKDNTTHVFGIDGFGDSKASFAIGASSFDDNGTMIQPLADFERDGEWHEIEIPMSKLKEQGLLFSAENTEPKNIFWFLSGGVAGSSLELDAVFIYKK
ncbi:MAG: Ig domain-containing protein [Bacteroidales bacterium]|nr:Ig domain-containing protein [Bacteroidales bacterium]